MQVKFLFFIFTPPFLTEETAHMLLGVRILVKDANKFCLGHNFQLLIFVVYILFGFSKFLKLCTICSIFKDEKKCTLKIYTEI